MEAKPLTIDQLAEHALLRLGILGSRKLEILNQMPSDLHRQIARQLLDRSKSKADILYELQAAGHPVSSSAFYRFAEYLAAAANDVHRDALAAGAQLLRPLEAAARLAIPVAEVDRLVEAGELAALNVAGERRFDPAALRVFLYGRSNAAAKKADTLLRARARRAAATSDSSS